MQGAVGGRSVAVQLDVHLKNLTGELNGATVPERIRYGYEQKSTFTMQCHRIVHRITRRRAIRPRNRPRRGHRFG